MRARRAVAALALAVLLAGGPGASGVPAAGEAVGGTPGEAGEAPYDSTRGDSVGEAALYLSWGAPHGMPGARRDVAVSCGDTGRVDTLYLSLETGRDLPRLFGMSGRIAVRPAPGDSLGAFWGFGDGGANRGGLLVQMDADGTFPCAQPWLYPGMGGTMYQSSPGKGELLVIYAVRPDDAVPVSGRTRYCLARLLLLHRRCDLDGARQPVCSEWTEAGYSGGGPDILVRRGPARFVTVNSPDGSVCATWRGAGVPAAWRPPAGRAPATRAPADSTRR